MHKKNRATYLHSNLYSNRRLLAVHAHPDDESITTGGLLCRCADADIDTCLVTFTDGRYGPINPRLAMSPDPNQLAIIRKSELQNAAKILGIKLALYFDFHDSGMMGAETNFLPRAFVSHDINFILKELIYTIRHAKPHIVITYDPFGFTGHPDHIQAHRITLLAIEAAAENRLYSELGSSWKVNSLYYPVYPKSELEILIKKQLSMGKPHPFSGKPMSEINFASDIATHRVDISSVYNLKKAALLSHKTQIGPHNPSLKLAALGRRNFEHYNLAFTRNDSPDFSDIFETI